MSGSAEAEGGKGKVLPFGDTRCSRRGRCRRRQLTGFSRWAARQRPDGLERGGAALFSRLPPNQGHTTKAASPNREAPFRQKASAQERTRTFTALRPLRPERSASTIPPLGQARGSGSSFAEASVYARRRPRRNPRGRAARPESDLPLHLHPDRPLLPDALRRFPPAPSSSPLLLLAALALGLPTAAAQPARPGPYDLPLDPAYTRGFLTDPHRRRRPRPRALAEPRALRHRRDRDPRTNRLDGHAARRRTTTRAQTRSATCVLKLRQNLHAPGVPCATGP